jgi:S1-C subfamily serine protease
MMPDQIEWRVPPEVEPKPENYDFDLPETLSAVVALHSRVPADAFTAEVLGTERAGNGVVIDRKGVVLTIGYLITEAEEIWLTANDGRVIAAHPLGFDQETGFGLVQALGRLELPALDLGESHATEVGTRVVSAGAGGSGHSLAAFVAGKQEFAGYWEYVLDEALFTVPAHPYWGGTGLIGPKGDLLGIGSLQLQQAREDGTAVPLNMYVPIDILKPILDDMLTLGRPNRPPRPWLGLYATEVDNRVVIAGLSGRGPAARADLRQGDVVLSVGGAKVSGLAALFRRIWSMGQAGVEVPMTVQRDGKPLELKVPSGDRNRFLKGPSLH